MPRPESKALEYLYNRFIGDDPERVASYEEAKTNAEVAGALYKLRTEAGLTQRALAERVGTTASVICRLEDADYDGHSLSMLQRIAAALGRCVTVRFELNDKPVGKARAVAVEKQGAKAKAGTKTKAKAVSGKTAKGKTRNASD